jgi:ubiquinone/menaquinone biosynthesis C-methylase UbiE
MSSKFLSRGADKYDAYMGRWSRRLAAPFLDFAGLVAGERVIDIGCGTGSLTFELPARTNIASVEAVDYEQQFVDAARERNIDPRINFQKGDACNLPFANGQFDRALSMLVLHFVADAHRAVSEMRRVVCPDGTAAATVWDNYGGQPSIRMFYDTLAAIAPHAIDRRNAALIRPMTQSGELRDAFSKAGFVDITETTLIIRMDFAEFDDYWIPQTTGQGSIFEFLMTLPDTARQQLEAAMRAAYLCGGPDGPRSFVSVAWAVRGMVPRG